jgi:hypothetical protein
LSDVAGLALIGQATQEAIVFSRLLSVSVAVVGISLVAVPAAGAARYGFTVSPRIGTPATEFKVSFVAPWSADGDNTEYWVEVVGPPACAQVSDTGGRGRRGQPEVLQLTARDDLLLPRSRSRWCRGSYVGLVYWQTLADAPNRYVGYVRFRVR